MLQGRGRYLPDREQALGLQRALLDIPAPLVEFDTSEPTWKDVQELVKAARGSSTLGPDGMPHKTYKCWPELLRILWKILRVIWRRGSMAEQWRQVEGVWIPKKETSTILKQFRNISLLSVEGKILFKMTVFLLKHKNIDAPVLIGGIPGMPGLPGTHWSGHPADMGCSRVDLRPSGALAGPRQCIWVKSITS